jgi:hypothetical protein
MDKELEKIFENYSRVNTLKEISPERQQEWLAYLNDESIAKTPVSWFAVKTPTGVSYGGDVSLIEIISPAKKVLEVTPDKKDYLHTMSETLQDYAIGLHESQGLINQEQASELVTMFQDSEAVKNFITNFKPLEAEKRVDKPQTSPKKIDPTWKAEEVNVIMSGDASRFDGDIGPIGVTKLRLAYGETLSIAQERSNLLYENEIAKHERNPSSKKLVGELRQAMSNSNKMGPDPNEEGLKELETIFNRESQLNTTPLSENDIESINRKLNDILIKGQQDTIEKIRSIVWGFQIEKKGAKKIDIMEPQL